MNELITALQSAGLIENDQIILDAVHYEDGSDIVLSVSIEDFLSMFGGAIAAEDKYSALMAADSNADDSTKGYARFFNTWHAAGLI